jgi:hypothetical protein
MRDPLMTKPTIDWKRFWTPTTGEYSLGDNGYLLDPDSRVGQAIAPAVVPFSSISERSCLVLLGEPGIGKTTAMESLRDEIIRHVAEAGERSLWLNLNICSQESTLYKKLFESALYQEWLKGDFALHLFLDSVDECQLRIDTLAPLLLDELQRAPSSRLRLRIACRTAEWPRLLSDGLRQLFDRDVGEYELVPLRKVDVIQAAKASGADADAFLSEVERCGAKPFAIKPVTLFLLLRLFARDARLPRTQRELFLRAAWRCAASRALPDRPRNSPATWIQLSGCWSHNGSPH